MHVNGKQCLGPLRFFRGETGDCFERLVGVDYNTELAFDPRLLESEQSLFKAAALSIVLDGSA